MYLVKATDFHGGRTISRLSTKPAAFGRAWAERAAGCECGGCCYVEGPDGLSVDPYSMTDAEVREAIEIADALRLAMEA